VSKTEVTKLTQEVSSSGEKKERSQGNQDTELQSVLDNYEQNFIKILDKISENQRILMKSRSDLYVTYFTVMSDIMQKSLGRPYEKSEITFGNAMQSKKIEEEMVKSCKDAQEIIENSIRLNNKLILDMIDLAMASNRLYASSMINNNMFSFFSPIRAVT
jgi:hypothetical protein